MPKKKMVTKILRREETGGDYYKLVLGNPFPSELKAGQFVMMSVADTNDPYLNRPYSISRVIPKSSNFPEGELHLLIKSVGRGSEQTRVIPIGSKINIIGGLGTEFTVKDDIELAIFVAGGIGVAPFVELSFHEKLKNITKIALIGGRTKDDIQAINDLKNNQVSTKVATEDGSFGTKGFVTLILEDLIAEQKKRNSDFSKVTIYSCGPEPLMKAVGKIAAREGIECQLALEALMGCGFGVCLGCVVKDINGKYVRVCKEGPVIKASELSEYGWGKNDE